MKDLGEFIKSLVRPFIICTSWFTVLYMWVNDIEIPDLLLAASSAIVGEYIIERAVKRFKEK